MECIYFIIGFELFSLLGNVIFYVLFIVSFVHIFQVNESLVLFVTTGPVQHSFTWLKNMEGSKKKRECALAQFTRYEKKLGEVLLNNADNRWALEKTYEELRTRFKDAENAHDSYVTGLEDEAATAEGAWVDSLVARFDKLELEVGKVIGSQIIDGGDKETTPRGAEAALGSEFGEGTEKSRDKLKDSHSIGGQDIHLPYQNPKPPGFRHAEVRSRVEEDIPYIGQDIHIPYQNPKPPGFRHAGVRSRVEEDNPFHIPYQNYKLPGFSSTGVRSRVEGEIPNIGSPNNHIPHQNVKPPSRHAEVDLKVDDSLQQSQAFGMPPVGHMRRRDELTPNARQFDGSFGQGNSFDIRFNNGTRVRSSGESNSSGVIRLGPTRAGSGSRGGAPVKFEKVSIGKFEGDRRKYPEWRKDFVSFIEPRFEDYELAFVLKCHLAESVQVEVSTSMGDYNQMWRRLDKRYGNISRLIDTILYDVKNLSASHETTDGIMQMIITVEKAARDLGNLNQRFELYNATTISIIEQAMSSQMKHEWVRNIARYDCNSQDKFESLLQFLGEWKDMLEYSDASIRGTQLYKEGPSFHAAKQSVSGSDDSKGEKQKGDKPPPKAGQKRKCWACNAEGKDGAHGVWVCPTFLEMSVKSRQDLVKVNNACQRCLEVGCPGAKEIKSCRRNFTCSLAGCGGEHNKYLHSKDGSTLHAVRELSTTGDAILPLQEL